MSKLKNKAKKSKLSEIISSNAQNRVLKKSSEKIYPKSYLFSSETINLINDTIIKLNEISPKKISKSHFIKAAILIASKMETEILFEAIKQIWY